MKKHQAQGITRLLNAFRWSMAGIKKAFRDEAAFRQEVFLFILLAPLGYLFGETPAEKCILIGSLLLVMIIELLNTAIENIVDKVSPEMHPLAGRAKDMGSAAVFLTLLLVFLVWMILLVL